MTTMAAATLPASPPTPIGAKDNDYSENANTIAKWVLSHPEGERLQVAQQTYQTLLTSATQSRQFHGNGHACVKLCSFVQLCGKSSDQTVRRWAFSEAVAIELFAFYLEWYEADAHRALKQTLDVLADCIKGNPDPETGRKIKEHVLCTLVAIVAKKSARMLTKSGLQCLDQFLNKKVVGLKEVYEKFREVDPAVEGLSSLEVWRAWAFHLFSWMELTYVCPLAGKCLVHVFKELYKASKDADAPAELKGFTLEVWQEWLRDAMVQRPEVLEDIKVYVLTPIFKSGHEESLKLLEVFNTNSTLSSIDQEVSDQGLLLQLAALEVGKKHGLVEEPSDALFPSEPPSKTFLLPASTLNALLSHPSIPVRSSAFALLVSSQATTKPFSPAAISLLRKHLAPFHADYDAKVRNEVLGLTKNLVKRLKNIITVAQRSLASPRLTGTTMAKKFGPEVALKDSRDAKEVLDRHEEFLRWYLEFLKGELLPTASYQRHITGVRATLLLLRVGKHAGATDDTIDPDIAKAICEDQTWIRVLMDLFWDPFDDVREGTAAILGLLSPGEYGVAKGLDMRGLLREVVSRARELADRTGRADHGDGAARSQGLLCSWLGTKEERIAQLKGMLDIIEQKVDKAENDLGHAAIESPVHADFAAVSYVWQVLSKETYNDAQLETLRQQQLRILSYAQRIWRTVKHVLCDDSPEGHLPEEMEDIEGLDTKDLLSFSFRAVHESSNLLRLLIGTLRLPNKPGVPFPPLEVFRETGFLAFEQLASLRHRGAFSTVSYTFTTCCQLTQNLKSVFPKSDDLLWQWYQGALTCIKTQASTTRRSAGIPSLIGGILAANSSSPSFDEVFSTLEDIARKPVRIVETDGSNLPQVHALNSLRDIFRSSLLSKRAEAYLARTLHLAATSLKSEVWAIRNCGLLLLRSLIDCLLGTGESKATIESGWDGTSVRISYTKYQTLPGVMLNLLRSADTSLDSQSSSSSGAAEAVFPVLDIIRRAGPPEDLHDELKRCVEGYLGSKLWHVREIAARTLCSFMLQGDWVGEIERLFGEAKSNTNRLHGILLTARFVIERKKDVGVELKNDSNSITRFLTLLNTYAPLFPPSPDLYSAHLEILNLLARLGFLYLAPPSKFRSSSAGESALLQTQAALHALHTSASSNDLSFLRKMLLETLLPGNVNTAARVLDAIPEVWPTDKEGVRAALCELHLDICELCPQAPEIRALAVKNLAQIMGKMVQKDELAAVPSTEKLDRLWKRLAAEELNPALWGAFVEASGTIMAIVLLKGEIGQDDFGRRVRSWGDMLGGELDMRDPPPFDTRFAVSQALRSFFTLTSSTFAQSVPPKSYLPLFSTLYTALIDDDDDVRCEAAAATSALLNIPTGMSAPVAADALTAWLACKYSDSRPIATEEDDSLLRRAIYRLTGAQNTPADWVMVPAGEQLRAALNFDDSLFAAEEQNLFVDEVREARRWCAVLSQLFGSTAGAMTRIGHGYVSWLIAGLESLLDTICSYENGGDGPMGWTADQHVFAVCARVVLGAVTVVKVYDGFEGGDEKETEDVRKVRELLEEFVRVGKKGRVHGALLEMARV